MGKIIFQGGITKMISSKLGSRNKRRFIELVDQDNWPVFSCKHDRLIQIEVVSFSSNTDFYEQILSILSFLRFVGRPISWVIYSDGTHTPQQIEIFENNFEFMRFEMRDSQAVESLINNCKKELAPYKEVLLDYAKKHPLGKRLFLYLNYEIKKTTLFLDSDILFYEQASVLNDIITEDVNGWYLPEAEWGCLDSRYIQGIQKQLYQVNGGFLLLNKNLENVAKGLEFLKDLKNTYEYFTEQTIVHILLNLNAFMPLDPRKFILSTTDQFDFSYLFPRDKMAIRHYTGPVRHKMWQRDWKWHLSLP